jgi:hypothetical protein
MCAYGWIEGSVKHLRVRCQAVLVLLALTTTMLGCGGLGATNRAQATGLVVSNLNLDFGTVVVGSSKAVSEDILNTSSSSITVSQVVVSGSGFHLDGGVFPLTLASNQSATIAIRFVPQNSGKPSGSLAISSTASAPITVSLAGQSVNAGQLSVNPSPISFGNVMLGGSQARSATLTNSGGTDLTISEIAVSGNGFQVSGMNLPFTLPANQSTNFSVTFTPKSSGNQNGTISVITSASLVASSRNGKPTSSVITNVSFRINPSSASARDSGNANPQTVTIPLTGAGAMPGQLSLMPSAVSFGNVQVESSQTVSETLINSGSSRVSVSQAVVTGAGFSVSGLPMPLTLGAGQSKTFSLTFTPTSAGSAGGNLAIASDASNSVLTATLSGAGVASSSVTANPSSLNFGTVSMGSSQTLPQTLTNSGSAIVTISQATVAGTGYSVRGPNLPVVLAPGHSVAFNVRFTPTTGGSAGGNLSITSNASNPSLSIPLSGAGVTSGSLTATASSLSFASVQVGNSQTLSETLTNTGGSSLTVTQANVTGTGFSVTGLTLPLTLIPGQSFTFGVVFTPTSAGNASGNIAAVSNASNPNLAISMSGSGAVAGQLTVSPGTLSFGSVVVGQSKSMTATLNATGSTVIVSSAATGTSEFALSGQSFPFSIAAGSSATITVTFTPQATGAASDSVSLVSNAARSPVEALTGNGTAPPQHSVDLTWNASTSSVTGYNIYRGGTSGGPYSQINFTLDSAASYIDNTVVAGNTYFYVTTAVDGNGVESVNSNQVQAVIPNP